MTYKGHTLSDLDASGLEEAETYVLTNILRAQQHLQILAAAYEEISDEQARRLETAWTIN